MCINSGSKSYICGLFSIFPNISNFNYRINWPCDYWLIVIKSLCADPMLKLFVLISEIPWDEHAWRNDIVLFVKRQVYTIWYVHYCFIVLCSKFVKTRTTKWQVHQNASLILINWVWNFGINKTHSNTRYYFVK